MSDALSFTAPRFQVAVTVEDPIWPFDAPGASSQLDCVSALAAGANSEGAIQTCSEHTYQYSVSPLSTQLVDMLSDVGPRYPVQNTNGPIKVFPSYSAYLFVAETLGHSKTLKIANIYPGRQTNGSTITTALGDTSEGQLVAYGFWDSESPSGIDFPAKFVFLNLEIFNQTQTIPRPTATFDFSGFLRDPQQPVTLRRLSAPGADIKDADITTWAGQNYASGLAAGNLVEEQIFGGKIIVQASEAVLVVV
ncbi:hypothetical protein C0993_006086 [Termitomyces sp. T159_Od127]|nr:hypothetical protein C0993_006086 [Termitomyces sp. T159_Od127]